MRNLNWYVITIYGELMLQQMYKKKLMVKFYNRTSFKNKEKNIRTGRLKFQSNVMSTNTYY